MNNRQYSSYSDIPSLKKFRGCQNFNITDKNNFDELNSDFDKRNTILNSYQLYYKTHKHFHPNMQTIGNINSPDYRNYLKTKLNNNKNENNNNCNTNEGINNILEAIKVIQENQKEIILLIKDLKNIKEVNINHYNQIYIVVFHCLKK